MSLEIIFESSTHKAETAGHVVKSSDSNTTKIYITSMSGTTKQSTDFTKATCKELTNITVTGTLAISDQTFSLPIRRDDGRLFLFEAAVVSGEFSVVINFPTSGQFTYSDEEANIDLPFKMFTVSTMKFDVLRSTI